jgi:ubiquinone/menaquinone biosynthesis C-methylase UbiE
LRAQRRLSVCACLRSLQSGVGRRLLDIGTGIGEPAIAAAFAAGPRGGVLAIDSDPEMIAIARERATVEKLSNIEFVIRRVEEMLVPLGSVDAVLCRWSLMFVDDLEATLPSLRRVLRSGGRLVVATRGPPDRVPALSLTRTVVHDYFGVEPPLYGQKTAFAISDSDRLAEAFRTGPDDRITEPDAEHPAVSQPSMLWQLATIACSSVCHGDGELRRPAAAERRHFGAGRPGLHRPALQRADPGACEWPRRGPPWTGALAGAGILRKTASSAAAANAAPIPATQAAQPKRS